MSSMGRTFPFWKTEKRLTGSHLSNIASTSATEYGPSSQFFSAASFIVILKSSSAWSSTCRGDDTLPSSRGLRNFASCINCSLSNPAGRTSVLKIPEGDAYPVSLKPSLSSWWSFVSGQLICVANFSSSSNFLPFKTFATLPCSLSCRARSSLRSSFSHCVHNCSVWIRCFVISTGPIFKQLKRHLVKQSGKFLNSSKGCHNCLDTLTNCCMPRKIPKTNIFPSPRFASVLNSFAPAGTPSQALVSNFLSVKGGVSLANKVRTAANSGTIWGTPRPFTCWFGRTLPWSTSHCCRSLVSKTMRSRIIAYCSQSALGYSASFAVLNSPPFLKVISPFLMWMGTITKLL